MEMLGWYTVRFADMICKWEASIAGGKVLAVIRNNCGVTGFGTNVFMLYIHVNSYDAFCLKGVSDQKCNPRIYISNTPTFNVLKCDFGFHSVEPISKRDRVIIYSVAKFHPKYVKCWGVWNAITRIAFLIANAFQGQLIGCKLQM